MQNLFEHAREERLRKEGPLAARMRPRTLDEYIGQPHILAPGRLLRRAIQADQLSSLIFYGPPGTGKTTLASVIANTTKSAFVTLNAVMTGIAELKDVTQEARRRLGEYGQRTILFVDEVHRWNRAQQDALLPWVENGTIILIGATTENPYFTVNRALVSRSRIFQLKPLTAEDIKKVITQALADKTRGYGSRSIEILPVAMEHFANVANGDARAALNALQLAVETTPPDTEGKITITLEVAEESIQHRAVLYDREGDYHFDTISAFIKSMRGSDPDAVFYWLAKMVYAGEDPRFIFRRMTIFASEDIGMADPNAAQFVNACAQAFDRVGLPEGHYPLAHAALYCATAPKSNSVMGFFDALKLVEHEREGEVPNHLKDASHDKEGFGHGIGYKYPHEYRNHWVAQQYLPTSLQGRIFYQPGALGYEAKLADSIRERRELQLAALRENESVLLQETPSEILTFSPQDNMTEQWLARAVDSLSASLGTIRNAIFAARKLQRHELVLDLSADTGMLTWEAVRHVPEGGVWALAATQHSAQLLQEQAGQLPDLRQPKILVGTPENITQLLAQAGDAEIRFDFIAGRNICGGLRDTTERRQRLETLKELLADGATLALCEAIPRYGQRLTSLCPDSTVNDPLKQAEEAMYNDAADPLLAWHEDTLKQEGEAAGYREISVEMLELHRRALLPERTVQRWMDTDTAGSYASRLIAHGATLEMVEALRRAIAPLIGHEVIFHTRAALLKLQK